MKSEIRYYDSNRGFGKIVNPEDPSSTEMDIFFHVSDVEGPLSKLLELYRGDGEPVSFEVEDSSTVKDGKRAVHVVTDFQNRQNHLGVVKDWDKRGFGHIEDYHSRTIYWFHYSFIAGTEEKFIRLEIGEPVIFSPGKNEKGPIANSIVKVDSRNYIQKFADFENYAAAIDELSARSPEEWDYITKKTGRSPILRSYINQTFKRVLDQGDLLKKDKSDDGTEYAYFNTGLVTPGQDEIYGYFVKKPDVVHKSESWFCEASWRFLEFNTEESRFRKYFAGDDAQIATYFTEAQITDLLFDPSIKVKPDWAHLLERKERIKLAEMESLAEEEFKDKIKESVDLAIRRVKRNYKTAIPHFYEGKIQLLLPLCFKPNKAKALAALVISKDEKVYKAHTILSIDQAYNNARLLAKPDREWLNP